MYVIFDDEVGRMKLEFWRKRVFVHYLANGSAVAVARRALRIWPSVKRICLNLGYPLVFAVFPSNRGLERLCVMCGFRLYGHENGITYMRCSNA